MIRLTIVLLLASSICKAQDTPLTYSRIINVGTISKSMIFDRSLIWCAKAFSNSNSAIKVHEKESGIIAGKGFLTSFYKVPSKKDSVAGIIFSDYYFDWLIETKEGKARFSLSNINLKSGDIDYPVYTGDKPPFKVMLQKPEKTQLEWAMAKKYFVAYLDVITDSLNKELSKKEDNW